MKNLLSLFFTLFFIGTCTTKKESATLSGTIHLTGDAPSGLIHVGLHYPRLKNNIGSPFKLLYLEESEEPKFSMSVQPGRYTLSVFTFEYEIFRTPVLIENPHSHIAMDITIPPYGIKEELDTVRIFGSFNGWDRAKAVEMVRDGEIWRMPDTTLIKENDEYQFLIEDQEYWDLGQKYFGADYRWTNYISVASSGNIIFNPSLYNRPHESATAQMSGYTFMDQYKKLAVELEKFDENFMQFRLQTRRMPLEQYRIAYDSLMTVYKNMEAKYDPSFAQIFIEKKLDDFMFLHPIRRDFVKIWQQGKPDSLKLDSLFHGSTFTSFMKEYIEEAQRLDPNSYLTEGRFAGSLMNLDYYIDKNKDIMKKYNLSLNYFENFLIDFADKTPNKNCAGNILYDVGSRLARMDSVEKAKTCLMQVKEKYPENWYVKEGVIDKVLSSLHVVPGKLAPGFAVRTLKGDSLKLSDLKGYFIFIDFWGSWCGPCLGELPNIKKLHAAISKEKLKVIGLAYDDAAALAKCIEENNIEYPNAIAPEETLKKYGITGYPTTILIDPEGRILAKDLRGSNLVAMVQEKIGNYKMD